MAKIANYADSNTNPVPTLQDYVDAGVTGVTATNLNAVNAKVDAAVKVDADTQPEVQALVDAAAAAQATADNRPVTLIGIRPGSGKFVVATGSLTRSKAISLSLVAEQDRVYA